MIVEELEEFTIEEESQHTVQIADTNDMPERGRVIVKVIVGDYAVQGAAKSKKKRAPQKGNTPRVVSKKR